MNPALWLLLGLQVRGWLRYLGRNLTTIRGALLALVGFFVFVPMLLSLVFTPANAWFEAEQVRRFGPALLVTYCLSNVIFSTHERALYFSPAEVQFLFTGPFSRRQVLAYKLLVSLLVSLPASLMTCLFLRINGALFPAIFLGMFLVAIFTQLFTTALGLLANALGERLFSRGRRLIGLLALVVAGLVVIQSLDAPSDWRPEQLREAIFRTTAWQVVTWPLRSFFDVMLAQHPVEVIRPVIVCLLLDAGLVAIIFLLDAQYQEAAAASSARIYARIQKLRGRHVDSDSTAPPSAAVRELPSLPYLGGVGPIFWRQLTVASRSLGRLMWMLIIIAVVIVAPVLAADRHEVGPTSETLVPSLVMLGVWLSMFLTNVVPFDFRGDIDRMAILKTLPIAPWRLALGQLLTPTLLLALLQWLTLAVAAVLVHENLAMLLAIALYVGPICFYLVALENLLFLLFPVRLHAATPGDFQAIGRNVLLTFGKLAGMVMMLGLAGLVGFLGALLGGGEIWIGLALAWPVVVLCGVLLVPLVGLAFTWFDAGRDTPQ